MRTLIDAAGLNSSMLRSKQMHYFILACMEATKNTNSRHVRTAKTVPLLGSEICDFFPFREKVRA